MEQIKNCLHQMVQAIETLELAKEDCKIVVDAAYDTLMQNDQNAKVNNIDKKVLVKIAKSVATNKITDLGEENDQIGLILQEALGMTLGGSDESAA